MSWGRKGKGKWITVYANGGHAYAVIAGLRLDTGSRDPNGARYGQASGTGPRWNKTMRDPSATGSATPPASSRPDLRYCPRPQWP